MFNLTETLTFDQANMVVETTENQKGGKDLYLKGICIQGGVKNANQRVYPVTEIGRAVKTLNDQITGGYSVLGEVDHPEGLNGWTKRLWQVKSITNANGTTSSNNAGKRS